MSNWKTYGFQNETTNYLNAVALTGGSISYGTAELVNGFVETCKASGIWDNLVDVGIFVGNDLNAALTKLKWHPAAGPYLTNVSGNFTAGSYTERGSAGGLTSDGTSQWLTSRVPLNNITPNVHLSFYSTNVQYLAGTSRGLIGVERIANAESLMLGYLAAGAAYQFRYGTGVQQAAITTPPAPGFFVGTYNSSLGRDELYISGASRGNTPAATPPGPILSSNLAIMAINSNGSLGLNSIPACTCTFYSIGTSLTPLQCSGFSQIVQSFQNQLSRAVL